MHMLLVFQYMIEFAPLSNPPERKGVFDEHLRAYLDSHGYDYYMGALGGMVVTYGHIDRFNANATQRDRELLVDWLRKQPVECVAMIGELETESEDTKLMESTPEIGIKIDNLTDLDRSQADAYHTKIRAAIQRMAKHKGGASERTDPEA